MSASCRCSPLTAKLDTRGFVCAGHDGLQAHWMCSQCTGPRSTCPQHPRAVVVPVRGLWANTRFDPARACEPPAIPATSITIAVGNVVVLSAGAYGLKVRMRNPPDQPTVLKLTLAGIRGHRYAVTWPGHAEAYMFPRPRHSASFRQSRDVPIAVCTAESWPAWSHGNTRLLGMRPDQVNAIMRSPCARIRWWFLMPCALPPLIVPPAAAMLRGVETSSLSLGPRCDAPLRPYSPALTNTTINAARCAWCQTTNGSKEEWLNKCAPDMAWA